MSVSIHHIYSSVTLLFSVVPSAALPPSENTQVRTKFIAPTRRASFVRGQAGFSRSHPRWITITLPSTALVHWSPKIQHALWRSTAVAVVAPQPCVALLSPWRRLCQRSCVHRGRESMVCCMAGTRPLFCVPFGHHQLGPWSPACPEPGDDVPEKCVFVCQWSSSCHPAQTGVLT